MADISKIIIGSSEYNLKDAKSRSDILDLYSKISDLGSPMHFRGVLTSLPGTTTGYADGDVIAIQSTDPSYEYNGKEFVCSSEAWVEFGDTSHLGALASKDTASGEVVVPTAVQSTSVTVSGNLSMDNYTPEGTVSQPTFTGTTATIQITTTSGSTTVRNVVLKTGTTATAGAPQVVTNVTGATFYGTEATYNIEVKPSGSVAAAFSGTAATLTVTNKAIGINQPMVSTTADDTTGIHYVASVSTPSFAGSATTFTGSYQPTGGVTVSLNSPNVSKSTTTITAISAVSTASASVAWYAEDETLVLAPSIVTSSVLTSNITMTYVTSVAAPAVNTAYFEGAEATISVSGTPNGANTMETTTSHAKAKLSLAVGVLSTLLSADYTPAGSIVNTTFTGTTQTVTLTVAPSGTIGQSVTKSYLGGEVQVGGVTGTGSYQPAGTVSQPIFEGTAIAPSGTFSTSVSHSHEFTVATKTVTVL